jgi:hypothetical protein
LRFVRRASSAAADAQQLHARDRVEVVAPRAEDAQQVGLLGGVEWAAPCALAEAGDEGREARLAVGQLAAQQDVGALRRLDGDGLGRDEILLAQRRADVAGTNRG